MPCDDDFELSDVFDGDSKFTETIHYLDDLRQKARSAKSDMELLRRHTEERIAYLNSELERLRKENLRLKLELGRITDR